MEAVGGDVDLHVRTELRHLGVPARFFYYFQAAEGLNLIEEGPGVGLVHFGFTRDHRKVCISPTDLSIWEVAENPPIGRSLINSSLEGFLKFMAICEKRISSQQCVDEEEEELGEECIECWLKVANDIRTRMAKGDSSALFDGSYWSDFLSDVENGDYG
ncbi:SUKH-4 family immunity protein [Actinomadura sp. GC306]|uniref:SUKH-4 family immunity protein n=1 Tax=Actinomadura sp. GC306 TaxID=2530367 RepID=UPI0014054A23|nr:SUKH-4 family immunity protein [Actinomadura sp. GC306]